MKLLVAGAGGHGCVVADAAGVMGAFTEIAFVDDRFPALATVGPWAVVGRFADLAELERRFQGCVVAVGNSRLRVDVILRAKQLGFTVPPIIHPRATISAYAVVDEGSVVLAGSVVNYGAVLGMGSIVNTGATVDHHCQLGIGVHVCPGSSLAGDVRVGAHTWFGLGAVAKQGIRIGSDVTVGAGTVCLEDVPDGKTVVGVPARVKTS